MTDPKDNGFDQWVEGETQEADERSREIHRLRRKLADAGRRERAANDQLIQVERRLEILLAVKADRPSRPSRPKPVKPKFNRKMRKEAAACFLLSDWHVEDTVHPDKVGGLNEFNYEIACKRVDSLVSGMLWYLEQGVGTGVDVSTIVLALLGDMINGYIHLEFIETNSMSPTEAIRAARGLCERVIVSVLDRTTVDIHVPCEHGNHGRLSKKPKVAMSAEDSLEYMMYMDLAERFASEKRLKFHVGRGKQIHQDIMGKVVRFTHGDDVNYQGGVHGLQVPLLKMADKWNKTDPADYTCIGHFHSWHDLPYGVVNGSLKGIDEFAYNKGFTGELPIQAAFLIDKEFGKCFAKPVVCKPVGVSR